MTTIITNIETLTGSTPLYLQYPGQLRAQPAFVEIAADGSVCYGINYETGSAVPCAVAFGVRRRIKVPNCLTSRGYRDLHAEISDRLQIIIEGMGTEWDGHNHVGTLTDEAAEALEDLYSDSENGAWDGFDRDEEAILDRSGE